MDARRSNEAFRMPRARSLCLLTALLILLATVATGGRPGDHLPPFPHALNPDACFARAGRHLVIVCTLDGRVSALDVGRGGALAWTLDADAAPMLSSSISRVELAGGAARLVPSLDGALYRYDDGVLEAVPFDADSLLARSFRVDDDTVVVGGRETVTVGVGSRSGAVLYRCGAGGCTTHAEPDEDEDVVVVRRTTRTVRSVAARSGVENWNFSVAQAELSVHERPRADACGDEEEEEAVAVGNVSIQVGVPDGTVMAVDGAAAVLWSHKFDAPIAHAWSVVDGDAEEISLFDYHHVPALHAAHERLEYSRALPMLYMGMHREQVYVQPSVNQESGSGNELVPRVNWKPYVATSPSRTQLLIPAAGDCAATNGDASRALSLPKHFDGYPFDVGIYLFDRSARPLVVLPSGSGDDGFGIAASLWSWWREVAAISVTTAIAFHLFVTRCWHRGKYRRLHDEMEKLRERSGCGLSEVAVETESAATTPTTGYSTGYSVNTTDSQEFVSRYQEDFTQVACLGRGGFGVVFEARNKLDDCSYAVKRISVPNRPGARTRVMREVKALAKLDHVGIVRYYQAWSELPPPRWQRERDRELGTSSHCSSPYTSKATSPPRGGSPYTSKASSPPRGGSPYTSEASSPPRVGSPYASNASPVCGGSPYALNASPVCGGSPYDSMAADNNNGSLRARRAPARMASVPETDETGKVRRRSRREAWYEASYRRDTAAETSDSFIRFEDSRLAAVTPDDGFASSSAHSDSSFRDDFVAGGNASLRAADDSDTDSSFQVDFAAGDDDYEPDPPVSIHARDEAAAPVPRRDREAAAQQPLFLYIQMQLCRRESLREWLADDGRARDHGECLWIFAQIVDAVRYVHACGLMHRDLKPSNIFFSLDGLVKIGDFGLATALADNHDNAGYDGGGAPSRRRHTDNVGTQLYMSPELVSGRVYSHKVDIFSLGLVLLELLTSFSTQMERARVLGDAKRLLLPADVERERPAEAALVRRMLASAPEQRPSAADVRDGAVLRDAGAPSRQPPTRDRRATFAAGAREVSSRGPVTAAMAAKARSRTLSNRGGSSERSGRRHSL